MPKLEIEPKLANPADQGSGSVGTQLAPKVPCGRVLGHGECCCEGNLCEQCEYIRASAPAESNPRPDDPRRPSVGVQEHAEGEKPVDEMALWRASLRAEMRPVADRYGKDLFSFVVTISTLAAGMHRINGTASQTQQKLVQLHARQAAAASGQGIATGLKQIEMAVNALVEAVIQQKGWTQAQITECQTDIRNASQLVMAEPGRTPAGLIIPAH